MANLRVDLLNEIRNQKYYAEIELVRLAQDGNMNYRDKITELDGLLTEIALINQKLGLADAYFQVPQEEQTQQPVVEESSAPEAAAEAIEAAPEAIEAAPLVQQPIIHQGQSHGE